MEISTQIKSRQDFREGLAKNHATAKECGIEVKRGKPVEGKDLYYLDAIEEALCFGGVDSISKSYNNKNVTRFSPRRKNSYGTELNKERVKRLEKLGLMTPAGRKLVPKEKRFKIDKEVEIALKKARAGTQFKKFPLLYQKIRNYNVVFYRDKDYGAYLKALNHLIAETKKGKMFGLWNDYERLLDY